MGKVKEYIDVIVEKGNENDMNLLSELLVSAIYDLKDYNEHCYNKYRDKLYEIAYGKVISEDMAHEWVEDMKPIGEHWTLYDTTNAMNQLGYKFNEIDFYVVANMMYNDYYNIISDNDTLALKMANSWLSDVDATDNKLYEYWKHISKRED